MSEVVMQPRCVHCLREQWAPAVYDISHGTAGCTWCGHTPPVYTSLTDYRTALAEARRRQIDAVSSAPPARRRPPNDPRNRCV